MNKHFFKIIFVLNTLFGLTVNAQITIPVVKTQVGSIALQELNVNVEVVGNVATTTFDMIFYNSSNRTLEGEFEFPLGEGQTVSRYALDIDGTLREGVVVEKEKGRKVFEEITRINVDPGLVEKTKGNNFKTRIYPFAALGTRRVVVAYEQELKTVNGKCYYRLPLVTDFILKKFSIEINLPNQVKPIVEKGAMKLKFSKNDNSYKASFNKTDYKLDDNVVIELPYIDVPSVYTENAGATTYFYTFAKIKQQQKEKILPKSLTIIYDVSASAKRSFDELQLLKDYMNACGVKQVRLVTFSYTIHTDVICTPGEALKQIEKSALDGATQLGCIDFSMYSSDEILLFTDGIGNIGKETIVAGNKPVQVINSNNVADHGFLRKIATTNHGNYINLTTLTTKEAYHLLTSNVYTFLGAKYNASQIKDVYPSIACPVGETFSVSGLLIPKTANMTLYFGYGATITDSITYEVSALKRQEANNVKRIWAQKKIAELEIDQKHNEDEIVLTAKKYGIVTSNTSLIVLDRVEDYVRYGIVPPQELRDQYNEMVRNKPTLDNPIYKLSEGIISDRKEFLKWWNTKFDTNAKFFSEKNVSSSSSNQSIFTHDGVIEDDTEADIEADIVAYVPIIEEEAAEEAAEEVIYFAPRSEQDNANKVKEQKKPTPISTISIQYWNPNVPYLSELKSTPTDDMYNVYLKLRNDYVSSPSFYMDVADYFYRENLVDDAIRIVSNLCEMKLEDAEIARSCAKKLEEYKCYDLAVSVFENVVKMRGEEPQSYRDLALACWENGEFQRAADLLYKVSSNLWDSRFRKIQQIALNELNALIAEQPEKIDTTSFDQRLMGNCPVDIRILLSWNTNNCDIDLWVTDPNGEKCYYKHTRTLIGGRLSDDITSGYGPEEFCLKVAKEGKYKISANYYGSTSQKLLQPVVVTATVFTNFGKDSQKKQELTLQLINGKDTYYVGDITFTK